MGELVEFLILLLVPIVGAASYLLFYLPVLVVSWVKERIFQPAKSKVVNRRVAIVGASTGIGRDTAIHWAKHSDVSLVLLARRQDALEEVARECRDAGAKSVTVLACDASDEAVITSKLQAADDEAEIDTVIVCAAVSEITLSRVIKATPEESELDQAALRLQLHNRLWKDITRINVSAATNAALALLPRMRLRRNGVIVLVGSLASVAPLSRYGVYGATKAWLSRFAHGLRANVRLDNVHVCHVLVGPVATQMHVKREKQIKGTILPAQVAKHLVDVSSNADLTFNADTTTHPWWQFVVSFVFALPPQCFAWLAKWHLVPPDMAEMRDMSTIDTMFQQHGALRDIPVTALDVKENVKKLQ
ncbi:MAG: hypothetical protein MHM6MM_003370 [Cercozoa sp. M6MM]